MCVYLYVCLYLYLCVCVHTYNACCVAPRMHLACESVSHSQSVTYAQTHNHTLECVSCRA